MELVLNFINTIVNVFKWIFGIKKSKQEGDKTMKISSKTSNKATKGSTVNSTDSHDTNYITNNYNGPNNLLENADTTSEYEVLQDVYTSLFVENGEIHSEKIIINEKKTGSITGKVYLDDDCKYELKGTFKNRILTGEYTSTGRYTDERGTINLKLISEKILSGFCTFSKVSVVNDQIRMSPYVWVTGENKDLAQGTYDFCTECHNENKKCCCAAEDVDMPIILKNEADSLRRKRRKLHEFSKPIVTHSAKNNASIRQILSKETEGITHCYFYNCQENRCNIYDNRPTDCRLFPFDIKLKKNTDEYWIGYYNELCERNLPDEKTMKEYAHILRPQLFLMFPYLELINRDDVCEKLKDASFKELYKVEDFIY